MHLNRWLVEEAFLWCLSPLGWIRKGNNSFKNLLDATRLSVIFNVPIAWWALTLSVGIQGTTEKDNHPKSSKQHQLLLLLQWLLRQQRQLPRDLSPHSCSSPMHFRTCAIWLKHSSLLNRDIQHANYSLSSAKNMTSSLTSWSNQFILSFALSSVYSLKISFFATHPFTYHMHSPTSQKKTNADSRLINHFITSLGQQSTAAQ